MKKILCHKNIDIIITIFFCIIIMIAIMPFTKIISMNLESLYMPFFSGALSINKESIWQIFTTSDHCWFIHSLVYCFTNKYMPQILGIHPQENIVLVSKTIMPIILFIFLFSLTNSFYKYLKNKNLYGFMLFSIFITVMFFLIKTCFVWLFLTDCWFYAYIFLPIFAINLNNLVEKVYVENQPLTKKEWIIFCFLIICTSISHEFFRFIYMAALFLGYTAHVLCFRKKIKIKHMFLFLGLILLNLITFISNTYQYYFSTNVNNNFFQTLKSYIPIFFEKYKEFFICENILLFIILTILYVSIIFYVKDKNKIRFFIYNLNLVFSLFIFSICLIVVNQNYDGITLTILSHCGIRFLTKIFILQLILSAFSYLLSKTKCSLKITSAIILVFFVITASSAKSIKNHSAYQSEIKYYSDLRKILYIWEKDFLLNKNSNTKSILCFPIGMKGIVQEQAYKFFIATYKIKQEDISCYEQVPVCSINMPSDKCIEQMKQVVFLKTGYIFTEQELQKLDFQKLYEEYKDNF